MAVTPASLRSLRNRVSSPTVFPSAAASGPPGGPDAGSTGEVSTTVPASLAASAAATPPGSAATTLASPPPGGSSHSAATSAGGPSFPDLSAPGSGRPDVNSRDPSGRNRGLASPSADRVSRRGGPPSVSIRQMLVRYFFRSALSVCTAAASQLPSGDSRSAVTRGIATKAARSWNGVVVRLPSAGDSALTVTPHYVDKPQFGPYPSQCAVSRSS